MSDNLRPLGDAVRKARLATGFTLRQLAERSGLSQRFLSDLENGRGNISIARLMAVSRAIDASLSELVAPLDRAHQEQRSVLSLIGLRGAGKSSIGRQVSEKLSIPFIELDAEIEAAAGLPLSQIFEIHGEQYYRRVEREVLGRLLREVHRGAVIAAGGGIVNDDESWRLLKTRTRTIWLSAQPEDHYARVMAQGDLRPMTNRPSAMAELRALLAARAPLYAQAEMHVETSTLSLAEAVQAVCQWVEPLSVE